VKKISVLIVFLLLADTAFSQTELKGVMGINFHSIPSIQDYINQSGIASSDNQVGSFVSAVIFAGEGGLFINHSFELTVEAAYEIYSFTDVKFDTGKDELAFNNFMPSVLGYYVIRGEGYNFKFGGGAGLRFLSVNEIRNGIVAATNYSSTGFGAILRAEGNTLLGGNVFANIGFEIRYDINGEPDNNGKHLYNQVLNENVNFNAFSTGVRLGITYIFGENI
jgi:hypothetical protein